MGVEKLKELVFVEKDQVVTDSLIVAEVFEKRHADVKRDIRNLECSFEFNQRNFAHITYVDSRGREQEKVLITQDGFSFLVMGYTGSKASEFKERYINEFNRMREHIKEPKPLSERDQLIAAMKVSIGTAEEVAVIKEEVADLKHQVSEQLTLDHGQQQTLHHAIKQRVESLKDDYEVSNQKLYSQIHSHLRRAFAAPKYIFVKRKDYQEAIAWVKSWRPLI